MHHNLEKRFINLIVAQDRKRLAYSAFSSRFTMLFEALAEDMGITTEMLGQRIGWAPVPEGGNAIMRGEADASPEDVQRLLELYQVRT